MKNQIHEPTAVVFIPLTQGKTTVIDFDDFENLRGVKWYAYKGRYTFYARRHIIKGKNRVLQSLHHFLIPGAARVDHIDGDGLNNRQSNLRKATPRQNQQGRRHKNLTATSQFRGVHRQDQKWIAEIKVRQKNKYLGIFGSEIDAAKAYDAAARKHFGEFATCNFSQKD